MKTILYILLASVTLTSCSILGINTNRKTPKQGNSYPKFTEKDSIRGALNPMRSCYDVKHYTISIDVNPKKESLKGYVDIRLVALETFSKLQIDLFKNMKMDSVLLEGKKQSFTRKYDAVYISTHKEIIKNSIITLRCYYNGKPIEAPRPPWEGGFVWKKAEDKSPWIGVACELVGASLWFPCKDHLSDEPDNGCTMNISVPKGLTVVCNGVQKSHETKNEKEYFTWDTKYPINNYNITLYIGKYEHFSEEFKGVDTTFTLDYYVLPEYLEKTKEIFKQTPNILKYFESIYGPYPWPEEGYKLVGSPFEGMEHQTAIAYGTGFRTDSRGFDYIILHESAHEWWGNSISVADFSDIFIHEGFATYSEVLFVEHAYGKESAEKYIGKYAYYIKNINPVVGPKDVNFWDYKDTDPYMKGAWTLHGLRFVINNDSLFFDIIKTYYQTRAKSIVTVQDFTNYVNTKCDTTYDWYFKQYLYKREVPTLQYRAIQDGKNIYLECRWKNVDTDFVLPIDLNYNTSQIRLNPTTVVQRFVFHDIETLTFNLYKAYFSLEKVTEFK